MRGPRKSRWQRRALAPGLLRRGLATRAMNSTPHLSRDFPASGKAPWSFRTGPRAMNALPASYRQKEASGHAGGSPPARSGSWAAPTVCQPRIGAMNLPGDLPRPRMVFQNLVAADVSRRKSSSMARTDVRGYGVLQEAPRRVAFLFPFPVLLNPRGGSWKGTSFRWKAGLTPRAASTGRGKPWWPTSPVRRRQ